MTIQTPQNAYGTPSTQTQLQAKLDGIESRSRRFANQTIFTRKYQVAGHRLSRPTHSK